MSGNNIKEYQIFAGSNIVHSLFKKKGVSVNIVIICLIFIGICYIFSKYKIKIFQEHLFFPIQFRLRRDMMWDYSDKKNPMMNGWVWTVLNLKLFFFYRDEEDDFDLRF